MKSDTFHMSMLFDFYGDLLTEKQKELFDLYYNEDLSLTEIAEHAEISRQGVRDAIIRAETILRDTEDQVGLVKKYSGYEDKLIKIREEVGYIIRVNSGLKNYEIAKRTESIVDIIDELLK
ncbi:MAG: DNA-binding protein [Clostridia bacterium]|nr:DNA-binding protein [Clostridia bacterium]